MLYLTMKLQDGTLATRRGSLAPEHLKRDGDFQFQTTLTNFAGIVFLERPQKMYEKSNLT